MFMYVKAIETGLLNAVKWYGRRIQESKWYLIPLLVDVILIPLKIVIVPFVCLTKRGRDSLIRIEKEMEEDQGLNSPYPFLFARPSQVQKEVNITNKSNAEANYVTQLIRQMNVVEE